MESNLGPLALKTKFIPLDHVAYKNIKNSGTAFVYYLLFLFVAHFDLIQAITKKSHLEKYLLIIIFGSSVG